VHSRSAVGLMATSILRRRRPKGSDSQHLFQCDPL
jgi:hypothetical protein